jgi:dCMP deaminase
MNNCCEDATADGMLVTKPEVSHAEENALMKLAKNTMSADGATAYVTLEPCIHCSKLLYNAGIRTVVFQEKYKEPVGTNFLRSLGITVRQL